ncbi:MAG: hypothetical protein ABIJ86_11355, partial [Spirochaetota bacterium]
MKYLKFLVVPLVALLIMAAQLASLLLRGDLPVLRVESTGPAQTEQAQAGQDWLEQEKLTAFLESATRRAGVATLAQPKSTSIGDDGPGDDGPGDNGPGGTEAWDDRADILVINRPFKADPEPRAVAGPFDADLDAIRNRTIAGLPVVIGFKSLTGTENPRLAAELGSWTGAGPVLWVGQYLGNLSATEQLPTRILQAWEATNGRSWDLKGAGIVLHAPHDD